MDKESQNKNIGPETPIILYDGICNLCTESIRFVIQRDSRKQFRFASLQSSFANAYFKKSEETNEHLTSMVLILGNQVYRQSRAALLTAKRLDGLWSFLAMGPNRPGTFRKCILSPPWSARFWK